MPPLSIETVTIGLFVALVLWAVACDVAAYRIPNRICAAIALLYPAFVIAAWPAVDPWWGLAVGAIALVIGFVCFAARIFGAGDAKLIAAIALWAGPDHAVQFALVTAIVGGALGILILLTIKLAPSLAGQPILTMFVLWGRRFRDRVRSVSASPTPAMETTSPAGTAHSAAAPSTDRPATGGQTADPQPADGKKSGPLKHPVPYGVAIGCGALAVAYRLLTTVAAS